VPGVLTTFFATQGITYDPQNAACGGSVSTEIPPDLCNDATAVTKEQCQALISLFNNNDGKHWSNITNR